MNKYHVVDCSAPFSVSGTSCFYVPGGAYTWDDCRTQCQALGGDLAMIKTAAKQQEAREYLDVTVSGCSGKNLHQDQWQHCPSHQREDSQN